MKECKKCGKLKSLKLFYNDKKSKDGKCWRCKECMNEVTYRNYQKKCKPKKDWSTDIGFKICHKCLEKKSISEFNLHHATKNKNKDGLRGECRDCQKAHSKEHYQKVKDIWNAKREKHRHDPKEQKKQHHYHLKKKFGISGSDYDAMLGKQDGKCAICGTDKPWINGKIIKNFAVDHDHVTGEIRSLLCAKCNQGLGNFVDSPILLRKAAEYLESFINL